MTKNGARVSLAGLWQPALAREWARLILRRRVYHRAIQRRDLQPRAFARGGAWRFTYDRRRAVRDAAQVWANAYYEPQRQVFLAELARLCNRHGFKIGINEYDGPPTAIRMKRREPRLTARTVLND